MRRLALGASAALLLLGGCAAPATTPVTTEEWTNDGGGLSHRQLTPWITCYRYNGGLSCVRQA